MSQGDDSAAVGTEALKNYERIMKKIEPFIRRPEEPEPRPREVWRRGEDVAAEHEDRFIIEHHGDTYHS